MSNAAAPSGKAIIVGHAGLPEGLVSAVAAITGRGDLFVPISNTGLGGAEIANKLVDAVNESGARVVFTDLAMGSCSMAAHRLLRERDDIVIVTGVNLPMLLYAATHEGEPPAQLADSVLERARQAMRVISTESLRSPAGGGSGAD